MLTCILTPQPNLQEARQGINDELAALSDARPRNLYLYGLFVADHQLQQPDASPAALKPAAVPEPLEATDVPSQPILSQLAAVSSSIGIVPPVTGAMIVPLSYDRQQQLA